MRKGRVFTVLANGRRDVSQPRTPIVLQNEDGTPFEIPDSPTLPASEDWITIPQANLGNGWLYLSDTIPPQYRKRGDGMVEMRGYLDPGSDGTTFWTFPVGYRHDYQNGALHFPCGGADGKIYDMNVDDSGHVKGNLYPGDNNMNGVTFIELSGIRYSVD